MFGEVSNTFIGYIHRVLNIAMKNAEMQQLINRNPCTFITPPKKQKTIANIIKPEEVSSYLTVFKDHYLQIAIYLVLFCGLRYSEALGLTWDDIDWKNMSLSVNHSVYWRSLKGFE